MSVFVLLSTLSKNGKILSTHQADMKYVAKCCKHFFGYFNTLETHSEASNAQLWLVNQVFFTTTVKLRTGARLC